jgi:hypothetical protein
VESDDAQGSSWRQLGRAFRHERGSQLARKLAPDAEVTRVD